MSTPQYYEATVRIAYRFGGAACVILLITNVSRHGFHLSDVIWPLLLSGAMFALGMQPKATTRQSDKWTMLYFATLSLVLFLFGTIIYQRLFQ